MQVPIGFGGKISVDTVGHEAAEGCAVRWDPIVSLDSEHHGCIEQIIDPLFVAVSGS